MTLILMCAWLQGNQALTCKDMIGIYMLPTCVSGTPLTNMGSLTSLISAWINNHKPSKAWDDIRYQLPNSNRCAIEVRKLISNFILHIFYGCNDLSMSVLKSIRVSQEDPRICFCTIWPIYFVNVFVLLCFVFFVLLLISNGRIL